MLTHVCIWEDGQWRRITAEEAEEQYRFCGVSSNSGLFMCELCGQFVSFTNGLYRKRYFRHSSGESNKDCEDRSINLYSQPLNDAERHLPIRIVETEKGFQFEVGIPILSEEVLQKIGNEKLTLSNDIGQKWELLFERLNINQTTYFCVGDKLAAKYYVSLSKKKIWSETNWPRSAEGYIAPGRLFSKRTGRLLEFDSDVALHDKYYYVTKRCMSSRNNPFVRKVGDLPKGFQIYEMEPTELDNENAKFFLKIHMRLTARPLDVINIWPPCVNLEDVAICKDDKVYTFLYGNVKLSFGESIRNPLQQEKAEWAVYKVSVGHSQKSMLIGRSRVLKSNNFIYSEKIKQKLLPIVEIKDTNNHLIETDLSHNPPLNNRLLIKAEYDGHVIICTVSGGYHFLQLSAGKWSEISNVSRGTIIDIFVGRDLVRRMSFVQNFNGSTNDIIAERKIYEKMKIAKGAGIPISHAAISAIANSVHDQRIKAWLRKADRRKAIPEDVLNLLKKIAIK